MDGHSGGVQAVRAGSEFDFPGVFSGLNDDLGEAVEGAALPVGGGGFILERHVDALAEAAIVAGALHEDGDGVDAAVEIFPDVDRG